MSKNLLLFTIFLMIFFHGIYTLSKSYKIGFSATPSLPYYVFLIDKKDLDF